MFDCVLGSKKIKKRLGKDIFIHPFKEENLKGSSYNLTATKLAYYSDNQKIALNNKGEIVLPPGRTVLIHTDESIYVRKNICATYHTKVSLASKGFSSISTTLDPQYFGGSLIALTNLSNEVKTIRSNQTIVTLMFYRVTGCDKEIKDNTQNRDDLMPREFKSDQFEMDINDRKKEEFLDEINQIRDSSWKKDYKELIKKVRKENNIEKITTIDIGIMIFYLLILVISVILFLLSKIDISLLITIIIFDIPFIINSIKEIYLSKRRD